MAQNSPSGGQAPIKTGATAPVGASTSTTNPDFLALVEALSLVRTALEAAIKPSLAASASEAPPPNSTVTDYGLLTALMGRQDAPPLPPVVTAQRFQGGRIDLPQVPTEAVELWVQRRDGTRETISINPPSAANKPATVSLPSSIRDSDYIGRVELRDKRGLLIGLAPPQLPL